MAQHINKDAVVAEIERLKTIYNDNENIHHVAKYNILVDILSFLDTLEVKDPYEQCIQYDSIKAGIQAHAETYSFNIESELFNQLTKEQQVLWRKEIEQACINGGEMGVELARDPRYKENLEMKEVDLEKEIQRQYNVHKNPDNSIVKNCVIMTKDGFEYFAKHFYSLGLKAQKGE